MCLFLKHRRCYVITASDRHFWPLIVQDSWYSLVRAANTLSHEVISTLLFLWLRYNRSVWPKLKWKTAFRNEIQSIGLITFSVFRKQTLFPSSVRQVLCQESSYFSNGSEFFFKSQAFAGISNVSPPTISSLRLTEISIRASVTASEPWHDATLWNLSLVVLRAGQDIATYSGPYTARTLPFMPCTLGLSL